MNDRSLRAPAAAADATSPLLRPGGAAAPDDVVLRASGLHKRFIEGSGDAALDVHVLQGIDLTVRRGETLASTACARSRACVCVSRWMRSGIATLSSALNSGSR